MIGKESPHIGRGREEAQNFSKFQSPLYRREEISKKNEEIMKKYVENKTKYLYEGIMKKI